MAFIDSEGMFGGERMAMLSDEARMAWPWFWCASNTLGRIELDYQKIMARAFRQFSRKPAEKQFWQWVKEYRDAFLLFVYQCEGQVWGQWECSEKYLPEYKLAVDKRTPAPVVAEFLAWRGSYLEEKKKAASSKLSAVNNSPNILGGSDNSQNFSLGSGEDKEKEEEETPSCPAGAEQKNQAPPIETPGALFAIQPVSKYDRRWFDQEHERWYYSAFWNRNKKAASRKAHEKRIKQLVKDRGYSYEEAAQFLVDQAVGDRERFEQTAAWQWRQNMLPATWLNESRWEDEARSPPPPGSQPTQKASIEVRRDQVIAGMKILDQIRGN